MKKIALEIEDEIYKELKNSLMIRFMVDSGGSLPDQFTSLIIKAIDDGDDKVKIIKPKKGGRKS